MAKSNPFRFTTKYQDDETDLVYYGYRYYNASTGRWVSRDRIQERGGLNLYTFVANDANNSIDPLGKDVRRGVDGPPCPCICQSVSVTGDPVTPPGINWYQLDPTTYKYGNHLVVTWTVLGDPKQCRYGQDEKGYAVAEPLSGKGVRKTANPPFHDHPNISSEATITYGQHTATYHDRMGIPFTVASDYGKWRINLNLSITPRCTGSLNTIVYGDTLHFLDVETIDFGPTDDY